MVVDFRRPRPYPEPVIIKGDCVEVVHTYKYLGVQLDDKLDWTANTDALCRKGQSRLYFLRRLASFNICKKLLQIFYQSVVASALLYAVVCWGGPQEEGRSAPGQTAFWDGEDEKKIHSCPQCRQTFTPRPVLVKKHHVSSFSGGTEEDWTPSCSC
ncbi:hypothetical protein L3Q82_021128 [Scortum barcoo]|uniref:Uncharacterized protein n=1 Tax=Scortum barcoo TaxID=214431 RepID=A0ACB8X3D6_9TELE|nr:hypothetical protein L3Q82_021128 [Scortum barcoo]